MKSSYHVIHIWSFCVFGTNCKVPISLVSKGYIADVYEEYMPGQKVSSWKIVEDCSACRLTTTIIWHYMALICINDILIIYDNIIYIIYCNIIYMILWLYIFMPELILHIYTHDNKESQHIRAPCLINHGHFWKCLTNGNPSGDSFRGANQAQRRVATPSDTTDLD